MTEQNPADKALPDNPPPIDIHARRPGKTTYYNGTIAERLVMAHSVTDDLNRNNTIREMMRPFGYTQDKIAQFTALQAAAASANTRQQVEYGEKIGAYDAFEKSFSHAKTQLSSLVKVAKVALKNDVETIAKLDLNGKKTGSTAAIITYMDTLYEALLSDSELIAKLTLFGYDEQRISACRDSYLKARECRNDLRSESAESQKATRLRDEKMAELNEWMYDYYALYKVAVQQQPVLEEVEQTA